MDLDVGEKSPIKSICEGNLHVSKEMLCRMRGAQLVRYHQTAKLKRVTERDQSSAWQQ